MKTDWFVFPPFEYYNTEQLTKEVKNRLIKEGKKCIAVYFDKTEKELHDIIEKL